MQKLTTAGELVGITLIAAGFALFAAPLGLIAAGLGLLGVSVLAGGDE